MEKRKESFYTSITKSIFIFEKIIFRKDHDKESMVNTYHHGHGITVA